MMSAEKNRIKISESEVSLGIKYNSYVIMWMEHKNNLNIRAMQSYFYIFMKKVAKVSIFITLFLHKTHSLLN